MLCWRVPQGDYEAMVFLLDWRGDGLKDYYRTRRMREAEREWHSLARVTSPFEGRVLELKIEPGGLISAGGTVLTLEGGVQQLEAVLFVPATVGKQIQRGMAVELSPSTVRRAISSSAIHILTGSNRAPQATSTCPWISRSSMRWRTQLMRPGRAACGPDDQERIPLVVCRRTGDHDQQRHHVHSGCSDS